MSRYFNEKINFTNLTILHIYSSLFSSPNATSVSQGNVSDTKYVMYQTVF